MAASTRVPGADYYIEDGFERAVRFEVTGASTATPLADFPVLVRLSPERITDFIYEDFYLQNGRDLIFLDNAGSVIPHEIDTWNPEGESLVWVKLPQAVNGAVFSMCYRSAKTDLGVGSGNAFSSYVGVWHLNESGDGIQQIADSTVNGLAGETHFSSLYVENGVVGAARRVGQSTGASASNGRILIPDNAAHALDVGTTFTASFWMHWQTDKPDWAYLVSRKDSDYDRAWGIQCGSTTDFNALRIWTQQSGDGELGGDAMTANAMNVLKTGWHHVAFVYDNRDFRVYIDGAVAVTKTLTQVASQGSSDYLVLGGLGSGYGAFNGELDEARYAGASLSADWIKAEYETETKADYLSAAAVYFGEESVIPVIEWVSAEDYSESILDLSYAYVQFAGSVRNCGLDASRCSIEYRLWRDGDVEPPQDEWQTLVADLGKGGSFSVPVWGLDLDMPYHYQIRAVNNSASGSRANDGVSGTFRTWGLGEPGQGGDVERIKDRYVHVFKSDDVFVAPNYVTDINVLVVGGGGAGGYMLGGGGAGGGVFCVTNQAVTTGVEYQIVVGKGGVASSDVNTLGGNGGASSVSLGGTVLVNALGGGAGGNYNTTDATKAAGQAGGSGGGGSYGQAGGAAQDGFGYDGGAGNTSVNGGGSDMVQNRSAAGGGGGFGGAGANGTRDMPPAGGSGGNGLLCTFAGTTQYYGAGGGGGVRFMTANGGYNWSQPGKGGSGVGGDAADPTNRVPAQVGVANTGSGGGGGSIDAATGSGSSELWQGANGADGIVIITYVVHGDQSPSEEPQIELNSVYYTPETHQATLSYRLGWAGQNADTNSVYALYSTDYDALVASNGTRVVVGHGLIGTGSVSFEVLNTAANYYVRLVAEKSDGTLMYSDQILPFEVPGLNLDSAEWVESADLDLEKGHVTMDYRFHWARAQEDSVKLYLLWSTTAADLEGEAAGASVTSFAFGQGKVLPGEESATLTFADPRLTRGTTYYVRLMAVEEDGSRTVYSPEIQRFVIPEKPVTLTLSAAFAHGSVSGANTTGDAYPENTQVTVTATAESGYYLSGWKVATSEAALASAALAPNSAGRTRYALVLTENTWIVPVFEPLGLKVIRGVQRYPWNNLVDIDYHLENDAVNARLVLIAEDKSAGWRVQLRTFRDNADVSKTIRLGTTDTLRTSGWHRVTWDANADGVAKFSKNVTYTLCICQGRER